MSSDHCTEPRQHNLVEPIFLSELADLIGVKETAERIGYSYSAVTAALRNNEVRLVVEIAAEAILGEETNGKAPAHQTFVVAVPGPKIEGFRALASAMALKPVEIG